MKKLLTITIIFGLSFGTRYNLGLAKVFNEDFFDDDVKAYNSVIHISIGYYF